MAKKAYYNTGASLMRSHARQYKDAEDNTAKITGERRGMFDCQPYAEEMAMELNREGVK